MWQGRGTHGIPTSWRWAGTSIQPFWKRIWQNLLKLNIYTSSDPASPSQVYPTDVHQKTCTRIFTTALFIKAKHWKLPKCPLKPEWKNSLVILSSHQNEWPSTTCNAIHTELTKKQGYILYDSIYTKFKNRRNSSMMLEVTTGVPLAGGGEGAVTGKAHQGALLMFCCSLWVCSIWDNSLNCILTMWALFCIHVIL